MWRHMLIYTVKPGDSVDSISAAYGIPVPDILYNNQLPYPYRLTVGQSLLLSASPEQALPRYDPDALRAGRTVQQLSHNTGCE